MKILRLTLFLLYVLYSILYTHTVPAQAASPPDNYHFNSFFPLLRFIPPPELKIYEQKDKNRTYDDAEIRVISEVGVCEQNNDCVAEIQRCVGASCGPIETEVGRCQQPDPDLPGTCTYVKNHSCNANLGGTDYSRPDNLAFPKEQNEWQRYDYVGNSSNPISSGTHNLSLSACDRAELQLITLTQAAQTKATVERTGEWPLGWVDWEYEVAIGDALVDLWGKLGSLQEIGDQLTHARDQLLLSKGNNIVDVSSTKKALCQKISSDPNSPEVKALSSAPLYPPSSPKGYARCSICVNSACLSTPIAEGLYSDTSVRPALASAFTNLFLTHSLDTALSTYKKAVAKNPLLPYTQVATSESIPTKIEQELKPAVSGLPSPFTLTALGGILDYQERMTQFKYHIQDNPQTVAGGATPSNISQNIINFVYGLASLFANITTHLIIIPEPMTQSIVDLQTPVYQTRDTVAELKKDSYLKISNLVGGDTPLYFGRGIAPAEARRRLAHFSCADANYSSPEETVIADYALGTRIGCNQTSQSSVPPGTCDGKLFAKLIAGSPYQNTTPEALTYFNAEIKSRLTPELMSVYKEAERKTGVPCEILAGIHAREGSSDPNRSLVSGRFLGTPEPDAGGKIFRTLIESAIYAGNNIKNRPGPGLVNATSTITMLSNYNGGGNSNCQLGYPFLIPYRGCPRLFIGEDDPYATNFLTPKHTPMFVLFCADHTKCPPQPDQRSGTFTVALTIYNTISKGGGE